MPDDQITFNQIPDGLLIPGVWVEYDNTRAVGGLVTYPFRVLVIGEKLAAGTAATNVPVRVLSEFHAEALFGRGSMLHRMFKGFRVANAYTETWAIPLQTGTAAAATSTVTLTGAATAAGVLALYIGGQRVAVSVASGAAVGTVGTALKDAVNAATDLPVTATSAGGVVTLTARGEGSVHKSIDVRVNYFSQDVTPPGLAVAIAAWNGGGADPDITNALAAVGAEHFKSIVMPYLDATNLGLLETFLVDRFGPLSQKPGLAFGAPGGTFAAISTLVAARNCPHVCLMGGQKSPTWGPVHAAILAAVEATESDPARPRQTLPLTGLAAPAMQDRYPDMDRNLHLLDGVATYTVDGGGQSRIERLVTTYKTNALGVPDPSYQDVETMRTLYYIGETLRIRMSLRFPRHKLRDDGEAIPAEQPIVTAALATMELHALAADWERDGIIENLPQFKKDMRVVRNATDRGRLDAIIPPDLVNQLRQQAYQIQHKL